MATVTKKNEVFESRNNISHVKCNNEALSLLIFTIETVRYELRPEAAVYDLKRKNQAWLILSMAI